MGPARAELTTEHRVLDGDARELRGIDDGSVHLVVTSPPYPMIEMWDEAFGAMEPRVARALAVGDAWGAFERMHGVLDAAWGECARVLAPGGLLCVNVGDATRTIGEDFALFPNHARILSACLALGFQPAPAILWRKPTNAPTKFMGSGMLPGGAYVTLEHEWILLLRKGGRRAFRDDEKAARRRSAFFWEERNQWFSDVWDLKGERQTLGDPEVERRSAAFPLELAYRLVAMHSIEGDLVLDPFAGTGTTLLAALALGRSSVGVESDPRIAALARARLARDAPAAAERTRARLAEHRAFVRAREAAGKPPAHANVPYGFPVVTSQERDLRLLEPASVEATPLGARVAHRALVEPRRPRAARVTS